MNLVIIFGSLEIRLSKTEIKNLLKVVERVKEAEGNPEVYLLIAANDYHPNTEKYLKEKGIRYFWSYEFE